MKRLTTYEEMEEYCLREGLGERGAMKRGHREELSRNEHDHWNLEGSLIPHR